MQKLDIDTDGEHHGNKRISKISMFLEKIPGKLKISKVNFYKLSFTVTCYCLLTLIYMGVMLHYVSYPFIAKSKGLNPFEVGIIMGVFPFFNIFTFPISGVVNKMNLKLTFALSSLLQCILFSLFAFVPSMSRIPFEVFSFLFPFIFSFPVAFFYNSTYTLLQLVFPKHATLILTIQYVFFSSAYLMGPPLGSLLYDKIGFMNMFLLFSVFGVILSSVCILMLYFSPIKQNIAKKEKPESFMIFRILSTPSVSFNLFFTFITSSHYFYFLPVYGPYIASRYGVGVVTVGLVFMTAELSHLIVALPLGYILNKFKHSSPPYYFIIMIGLALHAAGIFLYTPSSIVFGISGNFLPICFFGSLVIGVGFAFSYVPVMSVSLKKGERKFPSCPTSTNTIISGLITGVYSIGESVGPIVGGVVGEVASLDVVTFYLALIVALFAFFASVSMFLNGEPQKLFSTLKVLFKKKDVSIINEEDEEVDA